MRDVAVDTVFIGSCTNSRIEDLRAAAAVLDGGRQVRSGHAGPRRARLAPVKAQAEAEGLDKVFVAAGFEWREPGCSMCLAMNPDKLAVGERCASTSNRNFEGRQGRGGRTHLVSPAVAAATAVAGTLRHPRGPVVKPVTVVTGRAVPLDRSDVDTDQIIPSDWLKRGRAHRVRRRAVLGVARRPRLRLEPTRVRRRHHPRGGPELRHRLVPGARRVGAARLRVRGRHLAPLRRHLPQQLHEAGTAPRRGRARRWAGRCSTRWWPTRHSS